MSFLHNQKVNVKIKKYVMFGSQNLQIYEVYKYFQQGS